MTATKQVSAVRAFWQIIMKPFVCLLLKGPVDSILIALKIRRRS